MNLKLLAILFTIVNLAALYGGSKDVAKVKSSEGHPEWKDKLASVQFMAGSRSATLSNLLAQAGVRVKTEFPKFPLDRASVEVLVNFGPTPKTDTGGRIIYFGDADVTPVAVTFTRSLEVGPASLVRYHNDFIVE